MDTRNAPLAQAFSTPNRHPGTTARYTLILYFAITVGCTHASTHAASAEHMENPTMAVTTSSPEKASINPKFNAEQVLLRLLELIRSSQTIQDFTPERLSEAMGLEMNFDGPDRYGAGEILMPEWSYGFYMNRASMGGPRFELSFRERGHPDSSQPMTGICQIDFDGFTQALEATGFTRQTFYGFHGALGWDRFDDGRPDQGRLTIEVYPEGEANEPTNKINHLCVKSVVVR